MTARVEMLRRAVKAKMDAQVSRRAQALRRRYGLTIGQYDEMLERQRGVCGICHARPMGRRLNVDHNHRTGAIRGLIRHRCNRGLQFFADDSARLTRAASYVLQDTGHRVPAKKRRTRRRST